MSKNPEELDRQKATKFFKSKGIEARPLVERKNSKTPDFELYVAGKLWGYCELKSLLEGDWSGGLQNDPTYNTIRSKLHAACKQLVTINPEHKVPNIIFIINHHSHRGYPDLYRVLTGKFLPWENAEVVVYKYLKGLIDAGDTSVMDYIIWIDSNKGTVGFMVHSDSSYKDFLKEKISKKAYEKY